MVAARRQDPVAARPAPGHRFALWVVGSDGAGLHQVPIPACGGAFTDPTSVGSALSRLVAGRDEDRVQPRELERKTGEHLHGER